MRAYNEMAVEAVPSAMHHQYTICKAVQTTKHRPNHAYARWYLARALLLRGQWSLAPEELTLLRNKLPDWANSIAQLAEARTKMDGSGRASV